MFIASDALSSPWIVSLFDVPSSHPIVEDGVPRPQATVETSLHSTSFEQHFAQPCAQPTCQLVGSFPVHMLVVALVRADESALLQSPGAHE